MTIATTAAGLLSRFDLNRTATAINYTMDAEDMIIAVTSTAAARTITIPTAVITSQAGRYFIITDESQAAGTNNITIATEGAETINGNATVAINANGGWMLLYTDGSNLFAAELAAAA